MSMEGALGRPQPGNVIWCTGTGHIGGIKQAIQRYSLLYHLWIITK